MIQTGRPLLFNLDLYFSLIDQYVAADEVERALWLLNNPPAYFRANPPKRLIETRDALHKATWTPVQYKSIYDTVEITEESTKTHWPLRAQLLEKEIKALNEQSITPNICEYAPGSMWLSKGLEHKGLSFTYEYMSLDGVSRPDKPEPKVNIFCAFEIIEHLSNELELYQNALKFGYSFDVVMVSTPLYTFGEGLSYVDGWRNRPLGHLRAYTRDELHAKVSQMFINYAWTCAVDDTIVLMGKR